MPREIELLDFLRRVERLCDFLLNKVKFKDGSDDLKVIQQLKEDAADLQVNHDNINLEGLHTYMRGG
jgi:hypothetical protein